MHGAHTHNACMSVAPSVPYTVIEAGVGYKLKRLIYIVCTYVIPVLYVVIPVLYVVIPVLYVIIPVLYVIIPVLYVIIPVLYVVNGIG